MSEKSEKSVQSVDNIVTDNLDQIIDAPDGIKRLRELILQLAVQGKLVEQRPEEGTAAELLEQIKEAKRKDAEERKARGERVRKTKPLSTIGKDEVPFEIPKGWKWVRLGELTTLITKGSSPKWQGIQYVDEGKGILFVTSENVGSMRMLLEKRKFLEERFNEIEPRSILKKNDLLMNIVGASIGRCALYDIDEIANINQAVCLIRCASSGAYIDLFYLLRFMNSNTCIGYMFDKQVDVARANLSLGNIAQFLIPLPPLAEQKRIVAKVDELMAWGDELDALKQKRDTLQRAALKSSLRNLCDSPRLCVESSLTRITSNFSGLIRDPADVKQLRDAILQLAVQGRLVPQHKEDGTADELLAQIKTAKASDLARRKANNERIRKTKPLPPITPEEIPFEIPESWKWVRFGEMTNIATGYAFKSKDYGKQGIFVLRVTNISPDQSITPNNAVFLRETVIDEKIEKYYLNENDILVVMVGGSVGKIGLVTKAILPALLNQNMWRVTPIYGSGMDHRYLLLAIEYLNKFQMKLTKSTHGHMSMEEYKTRPTALPPLAEQQRIVEKVDELMVWCDELETLLQTQSTTAAHFAAAIAQQGSAI